VAAAKDSAEPVNLITLFQKLRDWIDDDPESLGVLAGRDLT
jgi:hypothetical protein